jgi:CBS domain-containing protein
MRIYSGVIKKYRDSEKQIRVKKNNNLISADLACCTAEQNVREAAEIMVKYDCGQIAVVESKDNLKPLGIITDRDITWRVVASGQSPEETSVGEAMSTPL